MMRTEVMQDELQVDDNDNENDIVKQSDVVREMNNQLNENMSVIDKVQFEKDNYDPDYQ